MADDHRMAAPARVAPRVMDGDRQPASAADDALTFNVKDARSHPNRDGVLRGLIAECYDAGMGSQPWDRFLMRLGGVLGCSGAALMTQSKTRSDRCVLWSTGPIPERANGRPPAGAELTPYGRAAGHSVAGRPIPVPGDRQSRDPLPEGWIWPRSLCGVALCRTDEAITLRAWRDRAAAPFGEADHRLFAELVPHVGRALGIHWFRQRCAAEGNPVLSVFDRLEEAVFIVDRDGRVTRFNRAADSMVRRRCGWLMIGDRLMPAAAKHREVFRRSLDDVFSGNGSHGDAYTVRLALIDDLSVPPVPVAVTRLDRASAMDDQERPLAAVISKDPMRRPAVLTPELAGTYQLTRSEARLAGMIVNGDSLIDAAAKLNISKNTARSHMKRIYIKTNTQNHADLVRTLSRSFLPLFNGDDEQIEKNLDGNLLN